MRTSAHLATSSRALRACLVVVPFAMLGCDGVQGIIDGNEFGGLKTALYGELDYEGAEGFNIVLMDYKASCEDLTQVWTPEEVDAFPPFMIMTITTGDLKVGEYDVDAEERADSSFAGLGYYKAGLDEDALFYSSDGSISISEWSEQRSIKAEFSYTFVNSDDGEEESEFTGAFTATFCRNLSFYDDSDTILGYF